MIVCLSGTPKSMKEGLIRECGVEVYTPFRKFFPDDEQYIRFDFNVVPEEVVVVQSMYPEQDRKVVELYLALEALSGLGVKISAVAILYMAYARQDKRFLVGEPVSVKALYQGLKLFGLNKVIALDVHTSLPFTDMGFRLVNIIPHSYMLYKAGLKVDLVLAPDKGAVHRAEKVAKDIGISYDYLEKYRDRVTGEVRIDAKALDVVGKNIVIVDDIISTGKTLAKAVEALYKAGANKVYAAVTHALISSETISILSGTAIEKLLIANTIEQRIELPEWIQVIDVSKTLCEALK
ncbi:MAG: ribose-phosphate diphosphokinase [Ignisphaera sp.]